MEAGAGAHTEQEPIKPELPVLPLLTALLLSPAAEASFGGKIRNIRIRERNSGSGYRVVVVVKDDCEGATDRTCGTSADTAWNWGRDWEDTDIYRSVTPTDSGPTIADEVGERWRRTRVTYRSAITRGLEAADVVLKVGDSAVKLSLQEDGAWDEATDETYTISARIVAGEGGSYLEARVQGNRRDQDITEADSVSIAGAVSGSDAAVFLGAASVRATMAFDLDAEEDLTGYAYDYSVLLRDGEETVDSLSGSAVLDASLQSAGLYSSHVKEKRNGDLKHTAITVTDTVGDYGMDVLITDSSTGDVLLSVEGDAPVAIERQLAFEGLTFDAPPDSEPYEVTLTLFDSAGGAVADPVTFSLEIDHVGEDGATEAHFDWSGSSQGRVIVRDREIVEDGEVEDEARTSDFLVAITGPQTADVVSAELQFNEPFEGAVPTETVVSLGFLQEWQKWVVTAPLEDGQGADGVEVEVSLYDAEDAVLEDLTWEGGFGDRQRANGKGTRVAASNSSATAELL